MSIYFDDGKASFFGDHTVQSGGMTLHELLASVGIHRPADLAARIGLTRQYAHVLWSGKQPMSRKMAKRIADKTGLDVKALLVADVPPPFPAPKGRPRARPPEA